MFYNSGMEKFSRNAIFDNFRGILVFVFFMLAVVGAIYRNNPAVPLPSWLFDHSYSRPIGPFGIPFTPVDLGMIFFYFVGGMTAVPAYKKRAEKEGANQALKHLFFRGIGLIGIGTVMYLVAGIVAKSQSPGIWGPLHSIGFTSLLTMFFLRLKAPLRAALGVAFIAAHDVFSGFVYTFLNTPNKASFPYITSDGGFAVCLLYAGFFLITTVLFDLYGKGFGYFLLGLLPILAYTAVIYSIVPPAFPPYNSTFMAVTYCVVALLFSLLHAIHKGVLGLIKKLFKRQPRGLIPLIGSMGKNLLLYYIIRYPVGFLGGLFYKAVLVKTGVLTGGLILFAIVLALVFLLELILKKKKLIIKL